MWPHTNQGAAILAVVFPVALIWVELRKQQHLQSKLACGQPTGRRDTLLKGTFHCALKPTNYRHFSRHRKKMSPVDAGPAISDSVRKFFSLNIVDASDGARITAPSGL
jgi:hypothetical protein